MKSRTKFDSQLDPFAVKGPSALTYLSNLGDWQELRDPNARTTKTELKHLNEIRDGGKELTPIDLYPGGPRQLKKIYLGFSSTLAQSMQIWSLNFVSGMYTHLRWKRDKIAPLLYIVASSNHQATHRTSSSDLQDLSLGTGQEWHALAGGGMSHLSSVVLMVQSDASLQM